jgi:catechol 2,3-dioxygenase-like lactoylglutathione lyase family enzyme
MMNNATSAVDFPGSFRIHMGLAVSDLERSTRFYETLFGQPPTKERPGYAKFEPTDPSVNLSLNEARFDKGARPLPAHYGIQVKSSQAVAEAIERFRAGGLSPKIEEQTACCYAVQDKAWVQDPDGNEWEVFVVTDADSPQRKDEASSCCAATGTACC